ncbi:MAG: ACT domain-containing protein [Candidatus Thorarchaeota archaeon]
MRRGEHDLGTLLRSMEPTLSDVEYVFVSMEESLDEDLRADSLLMFREEEGVTFILERNIADSRGLEYLAAWALITLSVHSDLEAIGFIARISTELAKEGISVNIVSAYYHDHLFVPFEDAQEAMEVLQALSENP